MHLAYYTVNWVIVCKIIVFNIISENMASQILVLLTHDGKKMNKKLPMNEMVNWIFGLFGYLLLLLFREQCFIDLTN